MAHLNNENLNQENEVMVHLQKENAQLLNSFITIIQLLGHCLVMPGSYLH